VIDSRRPAVEVGGSSGGWLLRDKGVNSWNASGTGGGSGRDIIHTRPFDFFLCFWEWYIAFQTNHKVASSHQVQKNAQLLDAGNV